ncbi:MAG: glycosyltransferase family 2 protein [Elusimicrobia bacterium]|nr:glycosyltransferase family 2 protein [Elusimicrobiota bacterium]
MRQSQRPRVDEGRLLLVVPRLPLASKDRPLRELIAALARTRRVDLLPAGPSAAETSYLRSLGPRAALIETSAQEGVLTRCRAAAARGVYDAVVIVDDAQTRGVVEELNKALRLPIVLAILGRAEGHERPEALLSGDGFWAPRRAREKSARQTCAAGEIWAIGTGTPVTQNRFVRRPASGAAWMASRLRRLRNNKAKIGLTTIIVPCFNGLRYTLECLAAVARHTPQPHEILVVDNGSSDGTADRVRRLSGVRLIRNKTNRGFAAAINQGMKAARGRYLVWLNSDVIVTPGWLDGLIACADQAPWVAAVGPCTDVTVGPQRVPAPAFKNDRDLLMFSQAWSLKNERQSEGVQRLTGFCLLLKREAIKQVGYLDERFGIGTYEEFDYCLRLRQAGYDLVVARDVFVRHYGHKSFRNFAAMAEQARLNREVFLDKWCRQALSFLDELHPADTEIDASAS